jgi:hypothetical protein
MKEFITPRYVFSPGTPSVGFVDLVGIDDFDVARLVAIINQTRGIVIYSTASQSSKYTSVVGTKVYLNADTDAQSADDELQVIYNKEASTVDMIVMLNNLLSIIANPGIRDKTVNADRVSVVNTVPVTVSSGTVTTVSTVTGVTTVSTLSNLVNFNGYQSQLQIIGNNINAWANTCRTRIS